MPCWIKCWIGLTERKNRQKRKKIMLDEETSCWVKLCSRSNFSSNIFTPIQHSFYVGSVYSMFHLKFHSDDVISNVRTSNFEWFNKTKTLCEIITIKKLHTSKSKWAWTTAKTILTIRSLICFKTVFEVFHNHPKYFLKRDSIFHNYFLYCVLERTQLLPLLYPLTRFTSAWLFIIRVYKLWYYHWQKYVRCHLWFDIKWKNEWTCMLRKTYWMTRANDINFHSTLPQHLSNILSNMLDKMLDRFN